VSTPAKFYDNNGELRLDGSLVGGGGAQPFVGVGVYLSASVDIGAGDPFPFNAVDFGDPAFLDSGNGIVIPAGAGGLYAIYLVAAGSYTTGETYIQAQVNVSAGSSYFAPVAFAAGDWFAAVSYLNIFGDGDTVAASLSFAFNPTIHVTGSSTELFVSRVGDAP
jgi:hypothetical protein